jgi:hypothetical protein
VKSTLYGSQNNPYLLIRNEDKRLNKTRGASLCSLFWAGAEVRVPGPWAVVDGPPAAKARLGGGTGAPADWPEVGEVTEVVEVVEVEKGPPGGAPAAGSPAGSSPWAAGAAPPRSLNRERSFLSSVWMSSTLPWGSTAASHLRQRGGGSPQRHS